MAQEQVCGESSGARFGGRCSAAALALLLGLLVGSGCVSLSYQPQVTIGLSPQQIPARVEVRDLQDLSPPGDRSRALGGTSATASDTLAGELATAVTDSLLESFRNDEVFREIRRRPEQTELIMSGSVRRFYGKSNLNALGYVSMLYSPVIFLGIPIYTSYGGVDLELSFARPDGTVVARYESSREFSEYGSIYRQPLIGIGTRLNQSFTEVVKELRGQILADRERLAQGAAPGAPAAAGAQRGLETGAERDPDRDLRISPPPQAAPEPTAR